MRNTLVIVCALALLVLVGPAWGNDWQKATGDGNWNVAANWSDGLPVGDGVQQTYAVDVGVGVYDITINQPGAVTHKFNNLKGVGVTGDMSVLLLEAGGVFDVTNVIWGGGIAGSCGSIFRMTGGVGNIAGARIGRYALDGHVEISGGTLLPNYFDKNLGDGKIYDAGWQFGDGHAGRSGSFSVLGSASSITVLGGEGAWAHAFYMLDESKLIAEIDSGGVTPINTDVSQSANLAYDVGDNIHFSTRGGTYTTATVDMRRQTGIIPTKDQAFTLMTGDCITGGDLLVLSPEDVGTWELVIVAGTESGFYVPNNGDNGSVTAIWKPAFAGDANADGDVDDSDLSILLSNFGDPGVWSAGEFNADGNIDDSDLSLLLSNFGSVTATTVPEPATLTLLGLGALALIRRRRNK